MLGKNCSLFYLNALLKCMSSCLHHVSQMDFCILRNQDFWCQLIIKNKGFTNQLNPSFIKKRHFKKWMNQRVEWTNQAGQKKTFSYLFNNLTDGLEFVFDAAPPFGQQIKDQPVFKKQSSVWRRERPYRSLHQCGCEWGSPGAGLAACLLSPFVFQRQQSSFWDGWTTLACFWQFTTNFSTFPDETFLDFWIIKTFWLHLDISQTCLETHQCPFRLRQLSWRKSSVCWGAAFTEMNTFGCSAGQWKTALIKTHCHLDQLIDGLTTCDLFCFNWWQIHFLMNFYDHKVCLDQDHISIWTENRQVMREETFAAC